jgi:hypothetical protein
VVDAHRRDLRFVAIPLTRIALEDPIASLTAAFLREVPELRAGAIAIVDSPRSPLDLDCSTIPFERAAHVRASRAIDAELHRLVRELNCNPARENKLRLSLFPSPPQKYFANCASRPDCKPHLAALASRMLGHLKLAAASPSRRMSAGALFTRFMIAGFAVFQALHALAAETFEGYPYLEFSLWLGPTKSLPSKSDRARALTARREVLGRIAGTIAKFTMPPASNLDQADAAILALTAVCASMHRGSTFQISHRAEGRFLVALDRVDREYSASAVGHSSSASLLA